jgi:lipopolysaccharide export system protein LptA
VSYQLTFGGGEAILIRDKGTANAVQGFVETDIVVSKNNTALTTSFLFDLDEYIQLAIQANVVTLPADKGTYTLTGNVLDLRTAFKIAATVAAFTLTGGDATFQLGKSIIAEKGTYTLTGNNANTTASKRIAADKGTFVLTGIDANFQLVKSIQADSGTYLLTGNDAIIQKEGQATLTAERGTFILTGLDANLIVPLYSFSSNVTIQTEQETHVTIQASNDYNVTITSTFQS